MRRLAFLALLPLFVLAVACSSGGAATAPRVATPVAAEIELPEQVLGLKVVEEDISANLTGLSSSYLSSVGLFSFREGDDLLRATLQVSRFNDVARDDAGFRRSIIGQLGSSVPIELRVGGIPVWLAAGSEQNIFAWFDRQGFFVLSARSDYAFPRSLLRRLLDATGAV